MEAILVSGCLRPAPEDNENRAFSYFLKIIYLKIFLLFLLLLFWFGECFLEFLKEQGRTLSLEAGNLGISEHSNLQGSREHRGPLWR